MEIKIACGCGQKYIFEFDPENGQLPAAVNCPACGADGTQEANDILTQIFPEPAAEPALEMAPPPPAVDAPPPPLPASVTFPQPIRPGMPSAPAPVEHTGEFSLGRGIGGAMLGAGLGAGLMYGFFELVHFRFPLMGVGIGALAGYGARLLGRGTDSTLGIVAAVLALAANAGTLYFMFGDFQYIYVISLAVGAWFAYRVAAN